MAKTRLNYTHRHRLLQFASKLVSCPKEEKVADDAYQHAAILVKSMVEQVLSPADMAILQKYDFAHHDVCIRSQPEAGKMVQFQYRDKESAPLTTNCRVFLSDAKTTAALTAHFDAKSTYERAVEAKLRDYKTVIDLARYFEDLLEIWPEIEELRASIGVNSVVAMNPEVLARVKADVATRMAA